jgi:hypothetical protein
MNPMSEEIAVQPPPQLEEQLLFELDQRRAKAYAASGYWPDAKTQAQALVKVEAGRELRLPAMLAMSEVHVIDGKPTLGAGAYAALVKASRRYDYRVLILTNERCAIRFMERRTGEVIGESNFTLDDATKAGLLNKGPWKQYPRNMLFARAMSNGVAWFCPDVTMGRVYMPDELGADLGAPPPLPDEESYADFGVTDEEEIPWPGDGLEDDPPDPSEFEPAG